MPTPPPTNRLSVESRWVRAGLAAGLAGLLSLVSLAPGLARGPSMAWPCGFHSLTGLPCLFCGGTRAVRALSRGQWDLALYLNPIAYLALPIAIALVGILAAEAVSGRRMVRWEERFLRWRPLVPILLVAGLLLWLPLIALALARPKPELVDLRNPIAAHLRNAVVSGRIRLQGAQWGAQWGAQCPAPPDQDESVARQGSPKVGAIPDLAAPSGDEQQGGKDHDRAAEPLRPHPER